MLQCIYDDLSKWYGFSVPYPRHKPQIFKPHIVYPSHLTNSIKPFDFFVSLSNINLCISISLYRDHHSCKTAHHLGLHSVLNLLLEGISLNNKPTCVWFYILASL